MAVVTALLPSVREFGPDVVVSDGLTLTPGLAAEVAGLPRATAAIYRTDDESHEAETGGVT